MKYESDKKEYAKSLVERYMQKIYAFLLKRTNNLCDAEDLAQEIVLKIYKTSVIKDIINEEAFVWSVAKNVFANCYRDKTSKKVISMENLGEIGLTDKKDILDEMIEQETVIKLQRSIAYLSKMQREILIAYYYEGNKQREIAEKLHIPLGTVKWHLSSIKNELKKGINSMRQENELRFNPIDF